MKRLDKPLSIGHPNLGNNGEGLKGAYDVVVATKEDVITPHGKKVRARVYSRVSPEQIRADTSGRLAKGAMKARAKIFSAIDHLKAKPETKEKLRGVMSAMVEGNVQASSRDYASAEMFDKLNRAGLHMPEKVVRFVNEEPTEIPAPKVNTPAMPKEVILPELPPED